MVGFATFTDGRRSLQVRFRVFYLDAEKGPQAEGQTVRREMDRVYRAVRRWCADGFLYTGITKDAARRCQQHNAGTASRYTRSRRPVTLIYQEVHPSQSSALKREAAIKAMNRPAKLAMIRVRNEAG